MKTIQKKKANTTRNKNSTLLGIMQIKCTLGDKTSTIIDGTGSFVWQKNIYKYGKVALRK
jgi:hypothetical protein